MPTTRAIEVFGPTSLHGSGYSLYANRKVYWPGGSGKFVGRWNLTGAGAMNIGPVTAPDGTALYNELIDPALLAPVAGAVDVELDFSAPESLIDFSATIPGSAGDSVSVYGLRLIPVSF